MKFTFSLFQGLSSCQNLLFFTTYLSQNSCVKFYTEEFLQQYSHFSIPHTFSTFRSYPLIFCDKGIIVVSCKKQLKIIFLCYSKGKDYCWCFYQLFGISFLGDQFLSIDSNRWDILNAQVQNIKNYEHNWLHKKWIAQIAEIAVCYITRKTCDSILGHDAPFEIHCNYFFFMVCHQKA